MHHYLSGSEMLQPLVSDRMATRSIPVLPRALFKIDSAADNDVDVSIGQAAVPAAQGRGQ